MKNKKNNIIAYFKCSFCGRNLEENEISFLESEKTEQGMMFYADCARCKSSSLIMVSAGQMGIASLGMATDLERDELEERLSNKSISADEIIDIYQYASGQEGNLISLIKNIKD